MLNSYYQCFKVNFDISFIITIINGTIVVCVFLFIVYEIPFYAFAFFFNSTSFTHGLKYAVTGGQNIDRQTQIKCSTSFYIDGMNEW